MRWVGFGSFLLEVMAVDGRRMMKENLALLEDCQSCRGTNLSSGPIRIWWHWLIGSEVFSILGANMILEEKHRCFDVHTRSFDLKNRKRRDSSVYLTIAAPKGHCWAAWRLSEGLGLRETELLHNFLFFVGSSVVLSLRSGSQQPRKNIHRKRQIPAVDQLRKSSRNNARQHTKI